MKKKDENKNPEIDLLKAQMADLDDKFKRLMADYQNQDKRYTAQKSAIYKLANESLIDKIIPVIDDLERAQSHLNDSGLGHVLKQFQLVLSGEGLTIINSDGLDFDPETMDCAEVVGGHKDKVVKTVAKGYRLFDKVLRPAKVEVGSGEISPRTVAGTPDSSEVKPT